MAKLAGNTAAGDKPADPPQADVPPPPDPAAAPPPPAPPPVPPPYVQDQLAGLGRRVADVEERQKRAKVTELSVGAVLVLAGVVGLAIFGLALLALKAFERKGAKHAQQPQQR